MTKRFLQTMAGRLARLLRASQIVVPIILIGLVTIRSATAADVITLELSAGDTARESVIVETSLPPALVDNEHFSLIRIDTGKPVPV